MKFWKEKAFVSWYAEEVLENDAVKRMQLDRQHGNTSTYEHCMNVAAMSFWMTEKLSIQVDKKQMAVGAVLHDFFLYDWHDGKKKGERFFDLHCFYHPRKALQNARGLFLLTKKEENIIRSHMFPTTLLHPPKCKEAWVVCLADKWCAIVETFEGKTGNILCRIMKKERA